MLNSRSIRDELWEQAREALVFYFLRRHGLPNAEDLAHDTLQALWSRDFAFEKEDQFLRVCYGFASRISKQGYREARKHAAGALDAAPPASEGKVAGMVEAEARVFLDDVCRTAEAHLSAEDWELVQRLVEDDRPGLSGGFGNSGRFRVHLHRMRRRLARLTGWRGRRAKV